MNALDSKLNVTKIATAVAHTMSNENQHRAHRLEQERIAREIAIQNDLRSRQETEDLQDDATVDELMLPIHEIVTTKGPAWVARGYDTVFRGTSHTLPEKLKFTARGTSIVNRVLALTEGTAFLMETEWKASAERAVEEMKKRDIARAEMMAKRKAEEDEVIGNLRDEIIHLLKTKHSIQKEGQAPRPIVRSYYELYKHLMSALLEHTRIRGLRATEVIHAAMNAQLAWAPNWEPKMAQSLARAQEREAEFQARRKEERKKGNFQKKDSNEAVRELSESEELAEEERAHEYVREQLEAMDPANPETNPPREGYTVSAEEAQEDMDSIADEFGGSAEEAKNVAAAIEGTSPSEENSDDHEVSEDEKEDVTEPSAEDAVHVGEEVAK